VLFSRIFQFSPAASILSGMETNTEKTKRVRRSRAEIEELLLAFEQSGVTQQEFCRDQGLSVATFSSWRRKASHAGDAAGGLRQVHIMGSGGSDGVTVRFPEGLEVIFPEGSSAREIAAVVGSLNSLRPC